MANFCEGSNDRVLDEVESDLSLESGGGDVMHVVVKVVLVVDVVPHVKMEATCSESPTSQVVQLL